MVKRVLLALLILHASCAHAFINPVSDVNWDCMFPMTLFGYQVGNGDDYQDSDGGQGNSNLICECFGDASVKVGVPIGFWEPFAIIDTVYEAWELVPFDFNLGLAAPYMTDGSRSANSAGNKVKANVHYYKFPVFKMLEMFQDIPCIQTQDEFDVGMLTEALPFFQNDLLALMAFPETILLANPVTMLACMADAAATAVSGPIDSLFWCLGAGQLYPIGMSTSGANVIGASSTHAARGVYLTGRTGLLKEYHPSGCYSRHVSIWTKSRYKHHLWHPMRQGKCAAFGYPEPVWTAGIPGHLIDNDFSFIVWRKVDCCSMGGD